MTLILIDKTTFLWRINAENTKTSTFLSVCWTCTTDVVCHWLDDVLVSIHRTRPG
ncbi:MAG: hypothetical protein PUP91_30955 [Rhizonema sp. PD37]|nr:hypothetical protein [Rhizonema sp. PD37]